MREPKIGDRVSFKARGREVTGTITDFKWKSKRVPRQYRHLVPEDMGENMAVVAEDVGGSFWTVPVTWLKVVGKGNVDKARKVIDQVNQSISQQKSRSLQENFEKAKENNLYKLRVGDPVIVRFKYGVEEECVFRGFVPGSGNVRFEQRGRVRTVPAKFVRPK